MDKQNEEIQDQLEGSALGRYEMLVTEGEFGKQEGIHKKHRCYISYI